jgi:AcrR family transcriptional regulator
MPNENLDIHNKLAGKVKAPARKRSIIQGRDLRNDVQQFKRELIINSAIDIFNEKGFQSTTVDEIAAAMSVTKAVVYWNFSSKLELLDEIVDRTFATLSQCLECIDHERSAAKNLAEVCFIHGSTVLANQKEVAVYLFERRNVSAELKRKITSQRDLLIKALATVLENGVKAGEFHVTDHELVAYDIFSLTMMTFDWRWHRDVKRHSLENLCVHFAEQALRLAGYAGEFPFEDGELTRRKA